MTDDFDFDFDVDRGRSASRTESDDPQGAGDLTDLRRFRRRSGSRGRGNGDEAPASGTSGNGSGNGSGGYAARARQLLERRGELLYADEEQDAEDAPPTAPRRKPPEAETSRAPGEAADDDWLSFGGDVFELGGLSPLRERDDGPAGPPTPGEARNFAKEARRRASRRPSPILDFDEERARLERAEEDEDFESVLATQPQKGRVARGGSLLRHASRSRVRPAPASLPRPAYRGGSAPAAPASPSRAASRSFACWS